jgi:antitoxin PrlF
MANATVTSKGQITVPKEIRDHLGVEPGDRISFQIGGGGEVIVQPETVDVRSLRGMLKRRGEVRRATEAYSAQRGDFATI